MAQNDNNSTLGAGTDSISVTGAGATQGSTSGGYTPSSAGSQGMGSAGQQLAGAGGASIASNEQVQRLAGPAADAMEKTADFLRSGDVRSAIEEQVRTNPGRTLLIALGLGYVVGKAIRR